MRTETLDKRVRGFVGDTAVIDSRAPLLFFESSFPVPAYAFADEDVRLDLLRPSDEPPSNVPFFYGPKGAVAQWYDLHVEGRVLQHAAWRRDDPAISDRIILTWQPGVLDRWMEEEEVVVEHPRDPHKRVEAIASSRHIEISLDGVTLADTTRPVLLFETHLPTRFYVPRSDVRFDALEPSGNRSRCPYKGSAEEYWSVRDRTDAEHVAWSYADPKPAVGKVAGMVSFYNEMVDVTVDGVLQERPVTVFSSRAHRPAAA
jgi:uncharacterized protein (DUF427 family)